MIKFCLVLIVPRAPIAVTAADKNIFVVDSEWNVQINYFSYALLMVLIGCMQEGDTGSR
jgi:hypothetical protein